MFCLRKNTLSSSADSEWGIAMDEEEDFSLNNGVDVTGGNEKKKTSQNNWGPVGFKKSNHSVHLMVRNSTFDTIVQCAGYATHTHMHVRMHACTRMHTHA